jgi:hypothetical protein
MSQSIQALPVRAGYEAESISQGLFLGDKKATGALSIVYRQNATNHLK